MTGRLTPDQQALVQAYMPYVRSLVNTQWRQSSRELQEDLIQQGYLALVDGVTRYDPVKHPNTSFGGYVKWRVHKYISEYQQMDETIRKPWSKIKGNEPSEYTTVPLQGEDEYAAQPLIDMLGVEDEGYQKLEDDDTARWIAEILSYYEEDTRSLYLQWMAGTIDWSAVDKDKQEILYMLDEEIAEGTR